MPSPLLSYFNILWCRKRTSRESKCLTRGELFACSWKSTQKNTAGIAFSLIVNVTLAFISNISALIHPASYKTHNTVTDLQRKQACYIGDKHRDIYIHIHNACFLFCPFFTQPYGWHLHAQPRTKRKLLQSTSSGPYSPLTVAYNGKICILFKAKRLAIRYRNNTFLDLTERVFGPSALVDTKGSVCTKEKAMYVFCHISIVQNHKYIYFLLVIYQG